MPLYHTAPAAGSPGPDDESMKPRGRARKDLPRVLFLGTFGEFSLLPLAALLDQGFRVSAVVVPRSGPADPHLPGVRRVEPSRTSPSALLEAPATPNIVHLAWEREIPVLEVGWLRDAECRAALEPHRPDVLCVACFPQILPEAILHWPRFGCLNLHPSLLPAYRGPAPLFWMFRSGEEHAGVTIHIMDAGVDSGDILFQEAFEIPAGITGAELQRECGRRGARLMAEAVRRLPSGTLPRMKQPPGGSYHSWPQPSDFEAPVTRPARWAYNFLRGASDWAPVTIPIANHRFRARHAIGYTETGRLNGAYERSGNRARIQFTPGILEVMLDDS
jgi:methionyl-tRNA formyltransferase